MKQRMILLTGLLLVVCATSLFAQSGTEPGGTGIVIDLGTFAGITTVVSALVTQILKVVPSISDSKLAKIGISAGIGAVVCIIGWALQVSAPLSGLSWWQVLIYGIATGLSGCGFYDLIKAIASLFNKDSK